MIGLGERAAERRDAVTFHDDGAGVVDEAADRRDVQLDVDVRRQHVRWPAHDRRELDGEDAELSPGARREIGDGLVVMDVDHRVDVGPQAEDLAVELMAHARRHVAVEQPAGGHVGDHDVVARHLLERDPGVLGVDHAVVEAGGRSAHRDVAERVVDVATGDHTPGIGQQDIRDGGIEEHHRFRG